jgi:DNA-binding transcriptional LysR family regulator
MRLNAGLLAEWRRTGPRRSMEIHQIRYFLAVAQTLNFTRAAEQCNVSQPALTRAIQQLEQELSGPLLRREGKLSHLTELGVRMLPLMRQCYESALAAKSLANSLKSGTSAGLALALSQTIDMDLLADPLAELQRAFPKLQLSIWRESAAGIAERLKKGDVELAIAGPLGQGWDRLDAWPLFRDPFAIVVHHDHALARRNTVEIADLDGTPILLNPLCESADETSQLLERQRIQVRASHRISSQRDLITLLEANLGIGVLPRSATRRQALRRIPIGWFDISRDVCLYSVAGRQRSAAADALIKLLRARDWAPILH